MSVYSVSTTEYVTQLIQDQLMSDESRDVLARWSDMEVQPQNGLVTLHSRAISTDGYIGQYGGTVTLVYPKINLDQAIAYPLTFPWPYPTTWAMFASLMKERYDVVVEDGDFTLTGNSITTPLKGTDRMDALPDPYTGRLTLTATPGSGKFQAGTSLEIVCTGTGARLPLLALFSSASPDGYQRLTDKG